MAEPTDNGGNGLTLSYKGASIQAKGLTVVWFLSVSAIVAAVLWSGSEIRRGIEVHAEHEQSAFQDTIKRTERDLDGAMARWEQDHRDLKRGIELQTCISQFDFKERQYFRMHRGAWLELCPWITPDPVQKGYP